MERLTLERLTLSSSVEHLVEHDMIECDCYSCNEAYKQILIEDDKIGKMSDEEIKKVYGIE